MPVNIRKVTLAYFSGTGGTKAVACNLEEQWSKLGVKVNVIPIVHPHTYLAEHSDLLMICSPVYAFRLASIVEKWVKGLPNTEGTPAAIISVAGGTTGSPNTACRVHCAHLLKRKGYDVVYEKMLIMPSNILTSAEEQLNYALIAALRGRTEQIVEDILAGKRSIPSVKLLDRILAVIGKMEHLGARFFGASITASKECNQCGLCVRSCPNRNITIKKCAPSFGFRCIMCMKCLYACPKKALSPGACKSAVLKSGFDIDAMIREAQKQSQFHYNSTQNVFVQGTVDYLNE